MNTKMILGGIVGGVVSFLLGWLVFGYLMADMMEAGKTKFSGAGVWKQEDQMIMWALILAQFAWSFLLAWVFSKMGSINAMSGFINGLVIFLLVTAGFNLYMYAFSNLYVPSFYLTDIAISAVFGGIIGAVVGGVMGMGAKKTSAI